MISKLNPAVPRYCLYAIAGLLWTVAGALLCIRAEIWLDVFPISTVLALELISAAIATAGYFFVFANVVGKNIERIHRLPERACIFAFTAWKGYVMIALMMTIGITLRNSSLPKYFLSVPYTAMGGMLLLGSVRFYRQFLATAVQRRAVNENSE